MGFFSESMFFSELMKATLENRRTSSIIKQQCTDCSRWFHPGDLQSVGESVLRCRDCWERQLRYVVDSFADPPVECPLCHTKIADIIAANPRQPFSLFEHLIDGVFMLLCARCNQEYTRKRADLYAKTRFGWEIKLR